MQAGLAEYWLSQDVDLHVPCPRSLRSSRSDRHIQRSARLSHENAQPEQAESWRTAHAQTARRRAHGTRSCSHLCGLSVTVPCHGNHLTPGQLSLITILPVFNSQIR